jgi:hypothetical protein
VGNNQPMFLRFNIAFVLSFVCLATPAWPDYEAGEGAYQRGDYATALRELRPLAEQGNPSAQFFLGGMLREWIWDSYESRTGVALVSPLFRSRQLARTE